MSLGLIQSSLLRSVPAEGTVTLTHTRQPSTGGGDRWEAETPRVSSSRSASHPGLSPPKTHPHPCPAGPAAPERRRASMVA